VTAPLGGVRIEQFIHLNPCPKNRGHLWVQNEDHIHLRLDRAVDLELPGSRTVRVGELMLGLREPRLPGPELSRDERSTVAYVKCSGYEVMKFVCTPGIKDVVPEAYHELCPYVDGRE